MIRNTNLILISLFILSACGPTPLGYTVAEFNGAVEKLYGKSPEEVAKVIGKPAQYSQNESGGKPFGCFGYEGVKDPITGKLSRATSICFLDGKLIAQRPSYSF